MFFTHMKKWYYNTRTDIQILAKTCYNFARSWFHSPRLGQTKQESELLHVGRNDKSVANHYQLVWRQSSSGTRYLCAQICDRTCKNCFPSPTTACLYRCSCCKSVTELQQPKGGGTVRLFTTELPLKKPRKPPTNPLTTRYRVVRNCTNIPTLIAKRFS